LLNNQYTVETELETQIRRYDDQCDVPLRTEEDGGRDEHENNGDREPLGFVVIPLARRILLVEAGCMMRSRPTAPYASHGPSGMNQNQKDPQERQNMDDELARLRQILAAEHRESVDRKEDGARHRRAADQTELNAI
jgi:hypothetical protein